MARIKYSTGITPIRNEHHGFTFQSSRSGDTMMKSQANDRARNMNQKNKQVNILKAVRAWKAMDPILKLAWSNFATTYPQPCRKDPTKFLTGYQNFIKRAAYLFLNYGTEEIYTNPPLMQSLASETVTFSIDQSENCLDCTDAYIQNFGMLPKAGDFLLMKILPMAVESGQYFATIIQTVECLAVYIDGLFLSLHFPGSREEIVYSIFLSKPVNQSVSYTGTKTRYMGCFTAKKFIDLSDTPKTYTGQAGKVATVNAGENALEFTTPGGGGLTCDTLLLCPSIISIISQVGNLNGYLIASGTIPATTLGYGTLYNNYAVNHVDFCPSGWHVPTYPEYQSLIAYLGGATISGGKLKETGLAHWYSPNTGATNDFLFGMRAGGWRSNNDATTNLGLFGYLWTSSANRAYLRFDYNSAAIAALITNATYGMSVRLVKNDSTDPKFLQDIDGNVYPTVKIGNQVLSASNWICTRLKTGVTIPDVPLWDTWRTLTTPGRCYFSNSIGYR